MSEIDYQALREKAEKATWGDWDSYKPHRGARGYKVRLSGQAIAHHVLKNNAEFIAAFNPKVALALLDELERNQQYIKSRDQENEDIALTVGKLRVGLEAKDSTIAAQQHEIRMLLNALEEKTCQKCNDTGMADSGGTQPWGEPIEIECDCSQRGSNTEPQLPQQAVTDEMTPKQASRSYCGEVRGYRDGWNACRDAMLQGVEHKRPDAIDSSLVEALRLVQCMLEDYRERNYGDAEGWIRHINTHMSDYSEAHGDDAYSVLHDLLPAAPKQEVNRG